MVRKGEKRKRAHLHPKDWDRRARILLALSEKRMTVTELARLIGRSQGYVSAVIWGVDRSVRVETEIAKALGRYREELFTNNTEAAA